MHLPKIITLKLKIKQLDKVYSNILKYDIKVVVADLNANWGKKLYKPTIGSYSKHDNFKENENN